MSDYFLADDLSGALDAAAAFHQAGRPVVVALSSAPWPATTENEVVGVTTETRNATPAVAAATVAAVIAGARARGHRLVYKKIDSTLRGPVAAELGAVRAAMPGARILFAPANPAVGRTVRGGVLLVRGVPVAETEFARDPTSPVRESSIGALLGGELAPHVAIVDAETEADLAAAVAYMDTRGSEWIAVGSGALARPVAKRGAGDRGQETGDSGREASGITPHRTSQVDCYSLPPDPCRLSPVAWPPSLVPCLLICGSAHPGNREQAAVLSRERGVTIGEFRFGAGESATQWAMRELRAGRGAALVVEERRGESSALVQALAGAVAEILAATGCRRVFVTGGETAFALCRKIGISTLTFRVEIEPGLCLSSAESKGGAVMLAIKPGGFGDSHTWVRAWDALAVT